MIDDAKVLAKVPKIAPRPILFYAFACVMIFRSGVCVSVKMYHFDFFALVYSQLYGIPCVIQTSQFLRKLKRWNPYNSLFLRHVFL